MTREIILGSILGGLLFAAGLGIAGFRGARVKEDSNG